MIDEEAIGERYRALGGDLDERRRRGWRGGVRRALAIAAFAVGGLLAPGSASAALLTHETGAPLRLTPDGAAYARFGPRPLGLLPPSGRLQAFVDVRGVAPRRRPRTLFRLPTVAVGGRIDVDISTFDFRLSTRRELGSVMRLGANGGEALVSRGSLIAHGALGAAAPRALERCASVPDRRYFEVSNPPPPAQIALDGTVEAYVPACAPSPARATVVDTATSAPAKTVVLDTGATALALAGRHLAVIAPGSAGSMPGSTSQVVVYDWRSGRVEARVGLAGAQSLALTRDGTVAATVGNSGPDTIQTAPSVTECPDSIAWLSVADPAVHWLPGCAEGTFIRVAGGRVATIGFRGPMLPGSIPAVVTRPLAGSSPARTVVKLPAFFYRAESAMVDWDGSRVAYPLYRCYERLGGIAVDRVGAVQPAQATCRLTLHPQRLRVRNGNVTVAFRCPDGCSGIVLLTAGSQSLESFDASAAIKPHPPGRVSVRVPVLPETIATARRHRGRLAVEVAISGPTRDSGADRRVTAKLTR